MYNHQMVDGAGVQESLAALRVEDIEKVGKGTWRINGPETGTPYYFKRATPSEVALTEKAISIEFPEDSNLIMPAYLGGEEALPPHLQGAFPVQDGKYTELMIVEGHPLSFRNKIGTEITIGNAMEPDDANYFDEQGIPVFMRGQLFTSDEIDRLERDIKIMNDAGVCHHDLGSNLFLERLENGQMAFYIIDFEPDSFPDVTDPYADVETIQDFRGYMQEVNYILPDEPTAIDALRERVHRVLGPDVMVGQNSEGQLGIAVRQDFEMSNLSGLGITDPAALDAEYLEEIDRTVITLPEEVTRSL